MTDNKQFNQWFISWWSVHYREFPNITEPEFKALERGLREAFEHD
jgi:hypothetical protein